MAKKRFAMAAMSVMELECEGLPISVIRDPVFRLAGTSNQVR